MAAAATIDAGAEPAAAESQDGVCRRCIVTGAVRPKTELVRFVVDPGGRIVPDVAGRLPGRGLWLSARRDIVAAAVAKRLFARAARAPVVVEDGLGDRVEALLAARCGDLLGLARRAGQAVVGFEKTRTLAAAGARGGAGRSVGRRRRCARQARAARAPVPRSSIA